MCDDMMTELVCMTRISKCFPGVKALDDCQFSLHRGEVHALVGENGAGKSTLMKCLSGIYTPDDGEIQIKGKRMTLDNPAAAAVHGIAMIHQELNLMPHLSIAENIFMGREFRSKIPFVRDVDAQNRAALELMKELHLDVDPAQKVSGLTVAMQQLVEIAKAVSLHSDILIMDEPTASLTDREIEDLFVIIRRLKQNGVGIIYISHRMEELWQITDRITVMRDGHYIDTLDTSRTEVPTVINLMVGRELYDRHAPVGAKQEPGSSSRPLLEVSGLCARDRTVRDVSFTLKAGEILGIAGLVGAGRTEMARLIFGADSAASGELSIRGCPVSIRSPRDAVAAGISYLSEDRKRYGMILNMNLAVNTVLASMRRFRGVLGGFRKAEAATVCNRYLKQLRVKTTGPSQRAIDLSGGNQQKVIIGKWLLRDTDIIIFDEPTRGIDVGAKDEIYRLIDELAVQGKGIIMISSELPEILRISHRVLVMCEGRITGSFSAEEASQEKIMACAVRFNER